MAQVRGIGSKVGGHLTAKINDSECFDRSCVPHRRQSGQVAFNVTYVNCTYITSDNEQQITYIEILTKGYIYYIDLSVTSWQYRQTYGQKMQNRMDALIISNKCS